MNNINNKHHKTKRDKQIEARDRLIRQIAEDQKSGRNTFNLEMNLKDIEDKLKYGNKKIEEPEWVKTLKSKNTLFPDGSYDYKEDINNMNMEY